MRVLVLAFMALATLYLSQPAHAVVVDLHYRNGSLVAQAALDVENGAVVGGSGTIRGGRLIGTLAMTMLFPDVAAGPLVASPANDCIPGAIGCYDVGTFSCGCNLVDEDTNFDLAATIPIDADGIAFQVGGAALNYGFALYDAGGGSVGEILVGDAPPQPPILNGGTAGGRLRFHVVPEPMSLALLGFGLVGLGLVRRPGAAPQSPSPARR